MHCNQCGQAVKTTEITEHLQHHIHDKQYGIRANDLALLLADIVGRLDKLEVTIGALSSKSKGKEVELKA